MKKFYMVALISFLFAGATNSLLAQKPLFPKVDTSFTRTTVSISRNPLTYNVLFREGESVVKTATGASGLARGNHDFTGYIPIDGSSTHGYLIVNHELRDSNSTFGDGGGMTVFEVQKSGGQWNVVGDFKNVDFSGVGGTFVNCGGAQTPYGTVLTAEEYPPASNDEMYNGGAQVRDTSDITVTYDGQQYVIKRWQNVGWMVDIDPVQAKATRKLWKMGRFSHEGGYCMPDGRTVYLTDDFSPSVLFKFVATAANDYTDGQLYFYKQSADGESGEWIALPMDFETMLNARDESIKRGATLFIRHEWITLANGKLYITETGLDNFSWADAVTQGGVPAKHFEQLSIGSYEYEDFYGRVLELDPATNNIRVFLEGGQANWDNTKNFSNPDGLVTITLNEKEWLVVNEDLNGRTHGRVSPDAAAANRTICEIFWIDPEIKNPTVDDLKRFLVGANGAETTGGRPTPDGNTYFVNVQHPSGSNPEPFNKSATIAITGFDSITDVPAYGDITNNTTFRVFPNPVTRTLLFNKVTDVAVYDSSGRGVKVMTSVNTMDVSDLSSGLYYIQTIEGDVQKLIVE